MYSNGMGRHASGLNSATAYEGCPPENADEAGARAKLKKRGVAGARVKLKMLAVGAPEVASG